MAGVDRITFSGWAEVTGAPLSAPRVVGATPRRAAWPLIEPLAHGLVLFALVFFRSEILAMELGDLSNLTTVVAVFAAWSVVRAAPRSVWSPSSVYAITFILFHVGMTAAFGLGHEPTGDIGEAARLWLYRPSTKIALWLTCLGLSGYAIGVRLAHLRGVVRHRAGPADADLDQLVAAAGVAMVVGSLLLWFAIALSRGGPGILVGSYSNFLDATEGSPLPWVYQLTSYGLVFLAASRWSRGHGIAVGAFALWALMAFPLGLRGEVLFPTFTALAVTAARRVPMRTSRAVLLAVALLSGVAMIRNLRAVGIKGASAADLGLNPLDGLTEMGASLRPVSEVVFWHQMGDEFADGATYWAPIDRSIYYLIPGWTRPPIEEDTRVMNVVTMKRAGPIGFSPVAEAYRNFAAWGAFGVMMLFGLLLGRVDTWPDARIYQCVAGVLLTVLLSHVRNSFVHVPLHLATGLLLIAALALLARARTDRGRSR